MNKMIEAKQNAENVFTDHYGLISGDGNASGNGIRYTAEFLLGLHFRGLRDDIDDHTYFPVIDSCMLQPGLFSRNPTKHTDQQGPDDYIAIIHMSKALNQKYHQWIMRSAQENDWVFLNGSHTDVKTLKSAWLGRFPQFRAHVKYANNIVPTLLERIVWAWSVAFSPRKNDQDSWILSWHLKRVGETKNKTERIASNIWEWRFKRAHPEGIGSIIGKYFGNPNHPTAVLLEGIIK